jgi:SAM-dependent methyltransferase
VTQDAAPPADALQARPAREDVVLAYRWLLGRAPEDEGVIARLLARTETLEALRAELLHSAEFRQHLPADPPPGLPHDAPPMPPTDPVGEAELEAMQLHLRKAWSRLGTAAPHWSCRPEPRFRPERLAANRRAFHATGLEDRSIVEGALARHRIAAGALGTAVEFGCGVGRATLHLAALCPEVTGIDVSAPHLELARDAARERGLDHIAWRRSRADRPMPAEGYGLWYSRHVLQHCPPPLARHLLDIAFAGLAPGGVAVFQLLTHALPGAPPQGPAGIALHALPQADVFALAAARGLAVLEVQEDARTGLDRRRWLSHLFVLRRPA